MFEGPSDGGKVTEDCEQLSLLDQPAAHPSPVVVRDRPLYRVTQLVTFEKCAVEYYHRYVLKEPFEPTPAMQRGTDLHAMIETYLKTGEYPDIEGLPDQQRTDWLNFKDSPYYKGPVFGVEEEVSLRRSDHDLAGRMDALYVWPGRYEIVDFKTGTRKSRNAARQQLQLLFYAYMLSQDIPTQTAITYTYFYVAAPVAHTFSFGAGDITLVEDKIDSLLTLIDHEEWNHHRCGWCSWCRPNGPKKKKAELQPFPF